MLPGAAAGLSGIAVHSLLLKTTADNLANLSTPGFQASRLVIGEAGTSAAFRLSVGQGARALAVSRTAGCGTLVPTGQALDVAIQGSGFFQVERDSQVFYTRAGSFRTDAEGYLVDGAGGRLSPAFQAPPEATAVEISPDGLITARDAQGSVVASGQVSVALFAQPGALSRVGGGYYQPTPASGPARLASPGENGAGRLAPGFLSGANVDPARELVNLFLARFGFTASLKVLKTGAEMTGAVLDLRA